MSDPTGGPARPGPLVVVQDAEAQAAVVAEFTGAGWTVADDPGARGPAVCTVLAVRSATDAQAAVLTALRGGAVLIRVDPGPHLAGTVADLVDDLGTIGRTLVVDEPSAVRLDVDTWRLAHEIARGATLEAAARRLHLSTRTANRRLGAARSALGADSRAQLVRALTAPERIPAAPA